MCEKDTPHLQIASMIKSKPKGTRNPSRRTRAKRKKTKYLSLRANLSPGTTQHSGEMTPPESTSSAHMHQQLDLFPLHPERSIEEKETENENVSCLFEAAEDGGATELNSLLGSGSSSEGNVAVSASVETPNYGFLGEEEVKLERTAMRRKGRDGGEEKWVCYSEVVEERKEEEVTSCDAGVGCKVRTRRGLSLKLDYEEIMSAWSDKGPLYVQMDGRDSPQTVPDLRDHDEFYDNISNGLQDCWGNSSNNGSSLWTVPERNPSFKVKEEAVTYHEGVGGGGIVGGEEWNKMCHREASVLRYKEKRQNRLFSKRIRYEVRKINAEKRPRMKGRFVKRS